MSRSMPTMRDTIDDEACAWLVRVESGELGTHGQADFDAWINADPRHAAAYRAVLRTWQDIPALPELADLCSAPARSGAKARKTLIAVGLAAVAAAAAVVVAILPSLHDQRFATAIGQARAITLSDGSTVILGAHSSLRVHYSANERRVALVDGEALFNVRHMAGRPFVVDAGASEVRDIGTRFNVNLGAASVQVEVVEGLVQTRRRESKAPDRLLRSGERAEIPLYAADPVIVSAASARNLPLLSQDRAGPLVFENVRLADLASDINRYYAPGVQLASPAIGDLRVTAAFRAKEIPAFLDTLSAVLPVDVQRQPSGAFVVRVRP